ncbi:MAG TPA: PaaI family thioesterase [Kofleriaceae bacterium]|nr:PaaI family thioesterase [Kofleriaceae bacterium]
MAGNEHEILAEARRMLGGLAFFRKMLAGELPLPPLAALMGFRLVEVAEGRVVFEADPLPAYYNGLGSIHGGFFATLLDSALGSAVNTTMGPGRAYATVDLKVTLVRPLRREVGAVRCIASAVQVGSRIATSEGRIVDAQDKIYAHGTATCMAVETQGA